MEQAQQGSTPTTTVSDRTGGEEELARGPGALTGSGSRSVQSRRLPPRHPPRRSFSSTPLLSFLKASERAALFLSLRFGFPSLPFPSLAHLPLLSSIRFPPTSPPLPSHPVRLFSCARRGRGDHHHHRHRHLHPRASRSRWWCSSCSRGPPPAGAARAGRAARRWRAWGSPGTGRRTPPNTSG